MTLSKGRFRACFTFSSIISPLLTQKYALCAVNDLNSRDPGDVVQLADRLLGSTKVPSVEGKLKASHVEGRKEVSHLKVTIRKCNFVIALLD